METKYCIMEDTSQTQILAIFEKFKEMLCRVICKKIYIFTEVCINGKLTLTKFLGLKSGAKILSKGGCNFNTINHFGQNKTVKIHEQ